MGEKKVKVSFTVMIEEAAVKTLKAIAKERVGLIGDVLADLVREEAARMAVDPEGYHSKYLHLHWEKGTAKIAEAMEKQRKYSEAYRRKQGIEPRVSRKVRTS